MNKHDVDISIIIRFYNEDKYLKAVMMAILAQQLEKNFEIIAVDNNSNDSSRIIAENYADKVLTINEYKPGKALNIAIRESRGKYIVVLSGHTIPANNQWLHYLVAHMDTSKVIGVYGSQLYNVNSKFLDKRILDIFSTRKSRIEFSNSDFWNANSIFSRKMWKIQPFDESVYELEDHYWTKKLLFNGCKIVFEPKAIVYHYSHIERLDREYILTSLLSEDELILESITTLDNPLSDWPEIMAAGLTLSSLTKNSNIHYAIKSIGEKLVDHWDFDVRWRMAQALGKIPSKKSVNYLIQALQDSSIYPLNEATWSLARIGVLAAHQLENKISQLPIFSLPFVALSLGLSRNHEAEKKSVNMIKEGLLSDDTDHQLSNIYSAGEITNVEKAKELIPYIYRLINNKDELCKTGIWAIGQFANKKDINTDIFIDFSDYHPDPLVRFEATVALGKFARISLDHVIINKLMDKCKDIDPLVRYGAIQSLRLISKKKINSRTFTLDNNDPDFGICFETFLITQEQ
jgi:glycosyltransferase involved in cell wall biosynthesis